jgi:PAS domain S-box-containing protein
MPTLQRRFSVIGGFVLLLVVLIVNAVVTQHQLTVQGANRERLAQSGKVYLELARVESLLKDAETGQRGFLYTEDPQYLVPYNQAVSEIDSQLKDLSQITADEPPQQAQLPTLRWLSEKKMSELARTLALFKAGKPDEAKALVLSNAGLVTMNAIRETLQKMAEEEHSEEEIRAAVFRHSQRTTVISIYVATAFAGLGAILLAFYILREMDLRERHIKQMNEREEWFRSTLTSLGDAVIATNEEGLVTFVNSMAEKLTGWSLSLALGKRIEEIFPIFNEYTHKPVVNPVKKVMELGSVVGLANHTVLRHTDGTLTPIEDSAAPIRDDRDRLVGVVLVFRDATAERESQEMLRKTEKLATAARLAATFAHEINNPLEAVVNLIYIVKEIDGLPDAAVQPLELAEHELERVSHIARQTLGFYRESKVPGQVDLPSIVQNVIKLYSNKLKNKSIRVDCEFGECPPVLGLAGELTQVVSNLISNAADAVAADGMIRVQLSAVQESGGTWARFVVEDNGPGIGQDLKNRIFEPFFTTKTDVGTGLGLWVTKEIVHRHGGRIEAISKSSQEHGAIFIILLPSAPEK